MSSQYSLIACCLSTLLSLESDLSTLSYAKKHASESGVLINPNLTSQSQHQIIQVVNEAKFNKILNLLISVVEETNAISGSSLEWANMKPFQKKLLQNYLKRFRFLYFHHYFRPKYMQGNCFFYKTFNLLSLQILFTISGN